MVGYKEVLMVADRREGVADRREGIITKFITNNALYLMTLLVSLGIMIATLKNVEARISKNELQIEKNEAKIVALYQTCGDLRNVDTANIVKLDQIISDIKDVKSDVKALLQRKSIAEVTNESEFRIAAVKVK